MILLLNNCLELFIVSQLCAYPFPHRNIPRSTKHPKHDKNYIKVSGPSNDHCRRQNESLTLHCRRSHTGAGLTLSMMVGKSSCTCP